MNREELQQLLINHEQWRNKVYLDSRGIATVGVGFNLKAAGARSLMTSLGINYDLVIGGAVTLTNPQVQELFDHSTNFAIACAKSYVPNLYNLPDPVQLVVVDMAFNMGWTTFGTFHHFISALNSTPPDFTGAAAAMRASLWFKQVGTRGVDDVNLMLMGVPMASTAQETAQ